MTRPVRPQTASLHTAPQAFHPGVGVALAVQNTAATAAILHYRHVDQAERWTSTPMTGKGGHFEGLIPAAYTASPYPLQYYFEFRGGNGAWSHPAFNASLSNPPYFAVFKRA